MKLSEILRLVWINLIQNKFKVVLTSIGIVVGAATIVMVIAIGRGGQMDVADQFKNLIFHMSSRQTVHRQILRVHQNQARQGNHQMETLSPEIGDRVVLAVVRECRRCPAALVDLCWAVKTVKAQR